MIAQTNHLSDEDILKFIDGEIEESRIEAVEHHLAICSGCRARQSHMRVTLAEAGEVLSKTYSRQPSSEIDSQLLLRARLSALDGDRQSWLKRLRQTIAPARIMAYASLLIVMLAAIVLYSHNRPIKSPLLANPGEFTIPIPSFTPGATRPVTLAEICQSSDDNQDPNVSPSLRQAVLQEYGIAQETSNKKYQIDYLINPQLGGTDDIRNLWPQSYNSRLWNAQAKDILERRLHQMVCSGSIDLAVAQREIATDWIAAYRKYIHQPA